MLTKIRDWGRHSKTRDSLGRLRCSKCREWKQPSEFSKNKTQTSGRNYACRACMRVQTRRHNLVAKYGITEDAYQEMRLSQDGRCACCGEEFDDTSPPKRACVDHNHATGTVRDLLCARCNLAAGNVSDSSRRAEELAAYLKKWNC